jgi:hypothetical protein
MFRRNKKGCKAAIASDQDKTNVFWQAGTTGCNNVTAAAAMLCSLHCGMQRQVIRLQGIIAQNRLPLAPKSFHYTVYLHAYSALLHILPQGTVEPCLA